MLQFERRYARNPTALSTWTVEPAFGGPSYFTITPELTAPGPLGGLLRRVLGRMFQQLNFAPFIRAAEQVGPTPAPASAAPPPGPVAANQPERHPTG